jgi:hypothetical protein
MVFSEIGHLFEYVEATGKRYSARPCVLEHVMAMSTMTCVDVENGGSTAQLTLTVEQSSDGQAGRTGATGLLHAEK